MEQTHGDDASKEKFFPDATAAGCGDDLGPLDPIGLSRIGKLQGEMRMDPMRGPETKKAEAEADCEANKRVRQIAPTAEVDWAGLWPGSPAMIKQSESGHGENHG